MTKSVVKSAVKVKIDIRPGKGTDYQRKLWVHWWRKVITDCQREFKAESETKSETKHE